MRLREWFRRERKTERPDDKEEQSGGRRGSSGAGRSHWRAAETAEREWDDTDRPGLHRERSLSHGLF